MKTSVYIIIIAIISLLALASLVFAFLQRRNLRNLQKSAFLESSVGSLTELGFLTRNHRILTKRAGSYALITVGFRDFPQLQKTFGPETIRRICRHIHTAITSQLVNEYHAGKIGYCTFCFLLRNRKPDEIAAQLDNITASLNQFNTADGHQIDNAYYFKPVYGVYLPGSVRETPAEMLEKSFLAALRTPEGSNYTFYDSEMAEKEAKEPDLALSMEKALQRGEFIVFFQPKIRVSDQRFIGAEVLLRQKTRDGLHSPEMFLPAAERYRIAWQLDAFVLNEVCRILSRWEKQNRELCPLSVNLSRTSFERPGLADECFAICSRFNVSPSLIEFDIREDFILSDIPHARKLLDSLHYYGFRCAVDKFGAGVCSLQLLGALPFDTLNLDRSFFSGDNNNRNGRYIIESILRLSAQLQIRTTAVGIDNDGQVQYLRQAACDAIQGFRFFKPMPLEKLENEIFDGNLLSYAEFTSKSPDSAERSRTRGLDPLKPPKNVVLFSWNYEEDTIEFSNVFSPVLGGRTVFKNAGALFRTTDMIHENDRSDFFRLLERCQRENGWVENTLRFYMLGGRYEWLEVLLHRDQLPTGSIIYGALADMSGWKSEVNRWKEKATRDPLTGLYNREHFEQNVKNLLESGQYSSAALLFVDVDDFKGFNDNYGHMCGDDVLCYMAKQILGVFRHSDIIARYGGDEFVVFAPSIERSVLTDRLDKLLKTFRYPYRNGTNELNITATLGAAVYPADGTDYETLLNHADCALYEAKENGKNRYVLYEPYMKGEPS